MRAVVERLVGDAASSRVFPAPATRQDAASPREGRAMRAVFPICQCLANFDHFCQTLANFQNRTAGGFAKHWQNLRARAVSVPPATPFELRTQG